ncbi:hypothetical protein C4565_10320 [Candidatus Parcubacteria bacterium]|jgi:hypothetical protein|nr:MAG: hypothetical protein C4565_10320 [Candidatus Parcubacteria bacterium]
MEVIKISLKEFTFEMLQDVIRVFDTVVGGNLIRYVHTSDMEEIKKALESKRPVERSFQHMKLWIQSVPFSQDFISFNLSDDLAVRGNALEAESKLNDIFIGKVHSMLKKKYKK